MARDIIAIAGSAGAVQELRAIIGNLPKGIPAAIFIVVHTSAEGPGLLAEILDRAGPLHAVNPRNAEKIKHGCVYVAPPDHHLLVRLGHVELGRGPRENGFRPAADPLFRSAAEAYGDHVIGIVLSGGMDDGTLGLQYVKKHGGLAIIQHPNEALYPSMPESALRGTDVDYVLRVTAMPRVLEALCRNGSHKRGKAMKRRAKDKSDPAVSADLASGGKQLEGPPSAFICPECGGSLWEMSNGKILHYQCHVGHAFTAESLVVGQDGAVEEALWTALRTLEETAALRRRLADDARSRKMPHVAGGYEERAQQFEQQAGIIRKVLLTDELPKKLKGYGSAEPAKFLSRQVEQSTRQRKRSKRHRSSS